ncbi:phosphodiester glycosidase family protein [Chakrabartyella piscis]|uniref:phosphodiester glycosidase family protein n=1 Tax=Chakrabartyella piscis TaxID=2918914 RepID=UPI002958BD6A|nr:phosphodiester glycosidase family protein [Chakrabartyella piscis]
MKTRFSSILAVVLVTSLAFPMGVLAGEVQFNPKGMDISVAFPSTGLHTDANVSSFIDSGVTYAINGGFFDAYYSTSAGYSYPDNAPRIFGPIIQDGDLINGGFTHNMVGFTSSGDVLIDRVTVTPMFYRNGSKDGSQIWVTNQLYTEGYSVSLMTDDFKNSFTVPTGATTVTVSNGVVTNINTNATQQVASGTTMLVFNSERVNMLRSYNAFLNVGDKITYGVDYTSTQNGNWNNVETAVTGGKILVMNGQNVGYDSSSYNVEFANEANQMDNASAARSYLGVKSNGEIILGTTTGTFPNIAANLVSAGCVSAISLDGGASSMLYANGSFQTSAGRNLAAILTFSGGTTTTTTTTTTNTTTTSTTTSSSATAQATAQATASKVLVDGSNVAFEAYNIGGSNYFKLRDLAEVLSGTNAKFSVSWDGANKAIAVNTGDAYTSVGGELATGDGQNKAATLSASTLYCNGTIQNLDAYTIDGNTYFKLRDLGQLIDFNVGWDSAQSLITITSSVGYDG